MSSFEEELKKYLGSDRGKDLDFEDLLDNVRLIYQKDRQRLREAINKCRKVVEDTYHSEWGSHYAPEFDVLFEELGLEDEE